MPRPPSVRRDALDAESLRQFLAAFDADATRASEAYEALRQRLVRVFTWERQLDAEALADETLDRVARRIREGVAVADVAAYAHRVAELLLLETRRTALRRDKALADWAGLKGSGGPPAASAFVRAEGARDGEVADVEGRHACLESCLAQLDPAQRELILRYYAHDGRARIEQREALAREQGIPMGALRNRALRLRDKLEACLRSCLGRRDASWLDDTRG